MVAAASKSGYVSLHHYESGAQVAVIPEANSAEAGEEFLCMAFAKQSRYIVTGTARVFAGRRLFCLLLVLEKLGCIRRKGEGMVIVTLQRTRFR